MVVRSVPVVLQSMNKVATAVQLRFNVAGSASLPDAVKDRLVKLAGSRITEEGILIIDAHRHRTQEQNKADALARLVDLVNLAAIQPRTRKKTRPTLASQLERLNNKRQRSGIKKMRQRVDD